MVAEQQTPGFIVPQWPVPQNVHALVTLRSGGYSAGAYAGFNVADHTGDDSLAVRRNRKLLREYFRLPAEPAWLQQVHSNRVILADQVAAGTEADASWTASSDVVCVVLTADCLPVLISSRDGSKVAAAHAGWRGLHAGIITNTVRVLDTNPAELRVWLGPAIGPAAFEVGPEVVRAFKTRHADNVAAFRQKDEQHWLCDIYRLARLELARLGIESVHGGGECTYSDDQRFYSYRRDGDTGRMASLIWLD
jgi:YfiH family protein